MSRRERRYEIAKAVMAELASGGGLEWAQDGTSMPDEVAEDMRVTASWAAECAVIWADALLDELGEDE